MSNGNGQPETTPQMLARLVRHGGKILICGGQVTQHLPDEILTHPQIVIWDDRRQEHDQRDVPMNVRAVMWTRYASHATVRRLNDHAIKARCLKYPMLKVGEVKRLLADIIVVAPIIKEMPVVTADSTPTGEAPPANGAARGSVKTFIAAHFNEALDYSERGVLASEARRIYTLAQAEHLDTTVGSIGQALRGVIRDSGKVTARQGAPQATAGARMKPAPSVATSAINLKDTDDFTQLDRLLDDAITALRLVQEYIPHIRKETERLRGVRQRVLAVFEREAD